MKTKTTPAAILLAAGRGKRFESNKLLYQIGGKTMYRYSYENLRLMQSEGRIGFLFVVTSHAEIAEAVRKEVPVIRNDQPELGIARSLQIGLAALREQDPQTAACLFSVADQPFLSAETLRRLLREFQNSEKGIAACASRGIPGNPVIFAAEYFPLLHSLTGDRGGKQVLYQHLEDVILCETDPAELQDIDTRSDAGRLSGGTHI